MTKYLNGKETAKIIRVVLKRNFAKDFPKLKFSVRSEYSSVRVEWMDGPSFKAVDKLLSQFQGKHFNGMEDIEEQSTTIWEGEEVCFNVYLSLNRDLSPEFARKILDYSIVKHGNCSSLDIRSVKIDVRSFEGKTYACFNGSECQESVSCYDGSIFHINQEAEAKSANEILDWVLERQQIEEIERKQEAVIKEWKEFQEEYLKNYHIGWDYLNIVGMEFEKYKVIGAKNKIRYGNRFYFDDENQFCYGYYEDNIVIDPDRKTTDIFKGREIYTVLVVEDLELQKHQEMDLERVKESIDPITPINIEPVQEWVSGKFAS